jgi:hypothetical protein
MKRTLALLLVLSLQALLVGQKAPAAKPNTLTPEEARDGWLLLFDGETTFGWKIDGEAKVEKGMLVLGGTKATTAETTARFLGGKINLNTTWEGKEHPTISLLLFGVSVQAARKGELAPLQSSGGVGGIPPFAPVKVKVPAGTRLWLRDVKFQPSFSDHQKIFNGKNLQGWKIFAGKGKKSKYTVTKEGWLNVKDGPGDLQTVKQFDDFALQLECISNGKYLNSGIFFRCIPGEYQQGYEAQIQNDFTLKTPRKYIVEEFDPQTHKLTGKKTVESSARDYGTGAIYRRVPARRDAAKDGEWFTMTVVVRERHIATWVNGIQQVDWTDNRPDNDNPRQGYRETAGAISIQGHDPTTDLSFRNIRVAPFRRKR